MNRLVGILVLSALCQTAKAEVVHCQFNDSFRPSSMVTWNTKTKVMTTFIGNPQVKTTYKDVRVMTGLKPYPTTGFSLIVFGDVPALHLRETGKAKLPGAGNKLFPFEAYWGLIPGRLPSNWLENLLGEKAFGPKGVCWSNERPYRDAPPEERSGGDHGGGNRGGHKCDHEHGHHHGGSDGPSDNN